MNNQVQLQTNHYFGPSRVALCVGETMKFAIWWQLEWMAKRSRFGVMEVS